MKDAYSASEGVSEYLRKMDENALQGVRFVPSWTNDYSSLKHLRWIRNQLTHEVGYDEKIVEPDDYEWLENFYHRLGETEDPLALLSKEIEKQRRLEKRRLEERRLQRLRAQQAKIENSEKNDNIHKSNKRTRVIKINRKRKLSFWEKLKRFFKGF